MPPKPKRSWSDVQVTIMAVSMASALGLWNLFAGPDREAALKKAAEIQPSQPEPTTFTAPAPVQLPKPGDKILLGGVAPQTQIIVQAKRSGGGGGGGGGGPVTSTSSS